MSRTAEHRLPMLLDLCRWGKSEGWWTSADIRARLKVLHDGAPHDIPPGSLAYSLESSEEDGYLVRDGPRWRLRAWSVDGGKTVFDLDATRNLVAAFREARSGPEGERLWAAFTVSELSWLLWFHEVRWDRERLAHVAVRGIRSVMDKDASLATGRDFAAALLAGATAYSSDRGKRHDVVFRTHAIRIETDLAQSDYAGLAAWLADPRHMKGQDPLAYFLPNRGPRRGFGWALTFGLMASPTLHDWSYSLDPLPPVDLEIAAIVTEGRHRPKTPQARVHSLLESVLCMVLREDRGRYPGVDQGLGRLDPDYRFQEETTGKGVLVRMHLAGKDFEGDYRFPSGAPQVQIEKGKGPAR